MLDADGDGAITQRDLEALLSEDASRAARAAAILQSAGPDKDGRVDFRRFCKVMVPGNDRALASAVAEYMSRSFV